MLKGSKKDWMSIENGNWNEMKIEIFEVFKMEIRKKKLKKKKKLKFSKDFNTRKQNKNKKNTNSDVGSKELLLSFLKENEIFQLRALE